MPAPRLNTLPRRRLIDLFLQITSVELAALEFHPAVLRCARLAQPLEDEEEPWLG